MRNILGLYLVLLVALPSSAIADYNDTNWQSKYIVEGQFFVKDRLKDPSSAKFRNMHFKQNRVEGKVLAAVCGEVNSKNSFGAYAGFVRFISVPPVISATEDEMADFSSLWNTLCR